MHSTTFTLIPSFLLLFFFCFFNYLLFYYNTNINTLQTIDKFNISSFKFCKCRGRNRNERERDMYCAVGERVVIIGAFASFLFFLFICTNTFRAHRFSLDGVERLSLYRQFAILLPTKYIYLLFNSFIHI